MSSESPRTVKRGPEDEEQALKLSVVLPTRNDEERILDGLDAIFSLFRGLDWELVLVDLGSDDYTLDMLEPFETYANVKLLYEETDEPLSLGHGYRLGSLVAAGGAILLADLDRPLEPRRYRDDLLRLRDEAPMLLYTPLHPSGHGGTMAERLLARRLRAALHAPKGERPVDPAGSVVMLTRELSMQLFMTYTGAGRTATYELVQLALLSPRATFVEVPVRDAGWAAGGWWALSGLVREAKAVTRRLRQGGR